MTSGMKNTRLPCSEKRIDFSGISESPSENSTIKSEPSVLFGTGGLLFV